MLVIVSEESRQKVLTRNSLNMASGGRCFIPYTTIVSTLDST